MSSMWTRAGALAVAALLGGGIAVGLGIALDDGGTTTVIREVEPSSQQSAVFEAGEGKTIGEIYGSEARGVVQVIATQTVGGGSFFGTPQQASASGSGFVIDKAGHIVTNYHVIEGADEVQVNFSGDDRVDAKVIGSDPSTDIAVLQIDAQARALTPLQLGNSDAVRVGDEVVAIGNPFRLERTVTSGIVSALQRQITAPDGFAIDEVIQTDAAINRGNSGGPLLNADGKVIGVNAQIESESGGNVGIGFAIPINTVKVVVSQIIEDGKVEHAYLGVQLQTVDEELASTFRLPVDEGALISHVVPGGPADRAGIKGGTNSVVLEGETYVLGGDVVTAADGEPIQSAEELRSVVNSKQPGDSLPLDVNRDGETETITVELGRRPTTPQG